MANRFITTSVLVIGFLFLMGTTAGAKISGTSTTQTSCTPELHAAGFCSIKVEGLLVGLGNTTNNKPTAFRGLILIREGTMVFLNPAGNTSQANGVPFLDVAISLETTDLIDAKQISKNGRALSDVFFHDDDLVDAIIDALTAQCTDDPTSDACDTLAQIQEQVDQHPNWFQTVVVTRLEVLGQQWVDSDTTTNSCNLADQDPDPDNELIIINVDPNDPNRCDLADALGNKCTAPPAVLANPKKYAWKEFTYDCGTKPVCHDLDNNLVDCPESLPLP